METANAHIGKEFLIRLKGTVTAVDGKFCVMDDGTGKVILTSQEDSVRLKRGDVATVDCSVIHDNYRQTFYARPSRIRVLGHVELPPPTRILPKDIQTCQHNLDQVVLQGTVVSVLKDEADPAWFVLTIVSDGAAANVWLPRSPEHDTLVKTLVDAEIETSGICLPHMLGSRRYLGPYLQASSAIVRKPPPADPFRQPGGHDHRQVYRGTVLASWNGRSFFLKEPNGDRIEVQLASGQVPPPAGSSVLVAAFSRTNAFYSRLTNALIEPNGTAADPDPAKMPQKVRVRDLLWNDADEPRVDVKRHGSILEVRGIVSDTFQAGSPQAQLLLDSDGVPVNVWIGRDATPPPPGSLVDIAGVCIINVEQVSGGESRLNGFSLAMRGPEDLTLVEAPPWWTPARLCAVIVVLLALLTSIFIWCCTLRILVERRSRELLRTATSKVSAELRTEERTRLAIELHDTIAQTLTGVTFEINAADRSLGTAADKVHRHLVQADRALKSCRDELRNCIWDLRSSALEQHDMEEALRQAVRPHVGTAKLFTRFNVPRSKLSDSTAHAILRIVRELSINALRHGHASAIRIAGELKDGLLRFSVRDDGCGFDTTSIPGVSDGHFGLQGIRERIRKWGGDMKVESRIGGGSKVTISINTSSMKANKGNGNG